MSTVSLPVGVGVWGSAVERTAQRHTWDHWSPACTESVRITERNHEINDTCFNELYLPKQQKNQVHIIELNVIALEFAPYKFGISNCPIKILIYFFENCGTWNDTITARICLFSSTGMTPCLFSREQEQPTGKLSRLLHSLALSTRDDTITSLPPSSKWSRLSVLGQSSIIRPGGADAVCTCQQWLWLRCRSSAGETCRWMSCASQSGSRSVSSFPGLHPLSPKGLTTSDCSPGASDFEPAEQIPKALVWPV